MAGLIIVRDDETLDRHFLGVTIDAQDPFIGGFLVPGWECRHCGWRVGSAEYPPAHHCPNVPDQSDAQPRSGAEAEHWDRQNQKDGS